MFVSLAPGLALVISSAPPVEPILRPPPHAVVLNAQQLRTLIVGSAIVDPNGPQGAISASFSKDGTYFSTAPGPVYMLKRGRYQFKGNLVCVEGICSALARDQQGYLTGTPYRGRWIWRRCEIVRQVG
jgi:hypothetical protein